VEDYLLHFSDGLLELSQKKPGFEKKPGFDFANYLVFTIRK